ncbi:aldehyde dehydrogenase family protein [Flagellimonas sp. HMM57]|uniref:aldehyde dehydrogenase family protein n=1 Tax=unclassified Flagellimonas TaxID=2644544 RepID=UPI0013D44F75|nr:MULTISPECIES: aldehyde dehydrogenase family protein [unclassified Flagellimonas]UII75849.1 aldehyde dehydrogenase family protein [Flagellimonas sp. HMM57]
MIENLVQEQRRFFKTQQTKDITYRKQLLKRFHQELISNEDAICDALYADFKKPRFEALASETQMVLSELKYAIDNLEFWAKPTRVKSIWTNFPSSDWIYPEPFGNVLIIAPWNYPFLLSISPLIGALAAGNTVVLKPSELSPNTSEIIVKIIQNVFPIEYVSVVEGGVSVSQELLSKKWDYIFFTGSSKVGKIVYKSAAEHLTPVTLELSGKNPCIVDATASIPLAAKRIVWGKFLNAGQTCIAPDYILVHSSKKDELIAGLKKNIEGFYGKDIQKSNDFARIATEGHYNKLKELLKGEDVVFGGSFDDTEQYIAPTLVNEPIFNEGVMEDEIFGPILPIISYESENDINRYLMNYENPLAFYVFSNDKKFQKRILAKYSFGGGAVNDTIIQIINKKLPFGGVGGSGIGGYHGKHTFDLFSHKKAIIKRANWIDVPVRYAPYTIPIKWVKKIKHLL